MELSQPEPSILTKKVPLQHNYKGEPLFVALPRRVELMEVAANDLFRDIGSFTVTELKSLVVPIQFKPLIDSLVIVRSILGGEGSI